MIAVEMAGDGRIDIGRIEARGAEIGQPASRRRRPGIAVVGIEHDQLGTGVHDHRRKRDRHLIGGQERGAQHGAHILDRGVADEPVERAAREAVIDRRDLEIVHLEAIEGRACWPDIGCAA